MSKALAAISRKPGWEHFPHAADVGVRGFGKTAAEAFEQAALALTAVVTTADIRPAVSVTVECQAPDVELLLVEWLNAIIYEMAVRRMLFSRFQVKINGESLTASLAGESADPHRHSAAVEAKGATVTALEVCRDAHGKWSAQCVIDV